MQKKRSERATKEPKKLDIVFYFGEDSKQFTRSKVHGKKCEFKEVTSTKDISIKLKGYMSFNKATDNVFLVIKKEALLKFNHLPSYIKIEYID